MTPWSWIRRRLLPGPVWTGIAFSMLLLLLLWATSTGLAHEGPTGAFFEESDLLLAPYVESPTSVQDGNLDATEYNDLGHWAHEDEGVHLYLEQDGARLYVGLVNGLGGWAAFGLGEGDEFDAKLVGWYGTAGFAEDRYVSLLTDELETVADVSQRGTEDIQGFAASLEGGVTTYEFWFLLEPEDPSDVPLEFGAVHRSFVVFGTTGQPPVSQLAEGDAHFLRIYPLRPTDNAAEVENLLLGAPPVDILAIAVVAAASLGVLTLVWLLLGRRRRRE